MLSLIPYCRGVGTATTATAMVVPLFQCALSFPDGFDRLGTIHLRGASTAATAATASTAAVGVYR